MEAPSKHEFSPSNILARLEELKRWQNEQEERLKLRQQQQRELLSNEQRRMCMAFDLNQTEISNQTLRANHHEESPVQSIIEQSTPESTPEPSLPEISLIPEVETIRHTFDDVPKVTAVYENEIMDKPKFKFLRRGEGLRRYKQSAEDILRIRRNTKAKKIVPRTEPQWNNDYKMQAWQAKDDAVRNPDSIKAVSETQEKIISNRNKQNQKDEVSDRPKTPQFYNNVITKDDYKSLLDELKIQRDVNELKLFEFLEEKADNSSFCSSSAAQILQIDQSTPRLEKLLRNNLNLNKSPDQSAHVRFEGVDTTNDVETDSDGDNTTDYVDIVNVPTNIRQTSFQNEVEWSSSGEEDNTVTKSPPKTSAPEPCQNDQTTEIQNHDETDSCTDVVFKSDLLKKRLLELENEIQTFRTENANLIKQRQQLSAEKRLFYKDKATKEKELSDQKISNEAYITEEKRKLAKEKMVFEKYVKDQKQPTRKEREEIMELKNQVKLLKEEIKVKDTKNGAFVARLRTQIRQMDKEMARVKMECEKLQKENKRLISLQKRKEGISNTKVLHEINKNLTKILPKALAESKLKELAGIKNIDEVDESESEEVEEVCISSDEESVEPTVPLKTQSKTCVDTLRDVIYPPQKKQSENREVASSYFNKENDTNFINRGAGDADQGLSNRVQFQSTNFFSSRSVDDPRSKPPELNENIEDLYKRTFGEPEPAFKPRNSDQKQETVFPDGTKETRYADGNVKTVTPEGIVKLMYYNGDLKETNTKTGIEKYFYAKTKTTHFTYPDGFQLLEFPNGQTEKRFKDGRVEIDFPNGYKKIIDVDRTETWLYSDGTRVINKVNGDKVIELPNGQKEIHTSQHKRREYPDGTVKILYPDSTTETRYAKGRVRIKDKNGRLIMDSYNN